MNIKDKKIIILIALIVIGSGLFILKSKKDNQIPQLNFSIKNIKDYSSTLDLELKLIADKKTESQWFSEDGYGLNVPSTIILLSPTNRNSIEKEKLSKLTAEASRVLRESSYKNDELNSTMETDVSKNLPFGGSVRTAFKSSDSSMLCVIQESSYPSWALHCVTKNDVLNAYNIQTPFTKVLGNSKKIFVSPEQEGNYARVGVTDGLTGYFAILKKDNNGWTVVYKGQDNPICELMRSNSVPSSVYKQCIESSN